MNIREHVLRAINDGLAAKQTQRDGVSGVLFTGPDSPPNGEFIPHSDLNYNSEYGYYRISQFPDLQRDCTNENPETIHAGEGFDFDCFIWADSGGNLALLGEDYQMADLYQALKAYFERGELDPERISEDDWAWDYMKGIDWAVREAQDYGWTQSREQIADTIRTAARRGNINGATRGPDSGKWYFNPPKFRGWLRREDAHKTGPKPGRLEEIITSGADARTIQHQLAAMVRQNTGQIPRVQLWQPCEYPGCDNEPVCGNCMMCQETHCHCFDAEK